MKYVVANWKMKMSLADVGEWCVSFSESLGVLENAEVVLAPSYVHVPYVFLETQDLGLVSVGAQDVSSSEKGSFTGDVGAFQIKDFCTYCIIGHSERNEPLDVVIAKRDQLLKEGITPIICFVDSAAVDSLVTDGVLLAWEDPANISKEGVYNEKPLTEIVESIRGLRAALPDNVPLLYGGSVNSSNVSDLAGIAGLDGVLVGQASLDPLEFIKIIEAYEIS